MGKRKSLKNDVETPKKQKLNETKTETPVSGEEKKHVPKKQKTPKGAKTNTPKNQKQNKKEKPVKDEVEEESDYEVELEVKPEKITKTMNEDNVDSDDSGNEAEDTNDTEEIENAVNENSENDEKKKSNKKGPKNQEIKTEAQRQKDIKNFIETETAKGKGKMRYVLFLGNLSYDTTSADIESHFEKDIKVKSVRIPQGKGPNKKPRGFGYLEVDDKESYLKALSKHHTFIKGRRINVLYTTGGNKNSKKTKNQLKQKNYKLNALRKEGKLEGNQKHSNKRSVRRAKKRSFEKKTE